MKTVMNTALLLQAAALLLTLPITVKADQTVPFRGSLQGFEVDSFGPSTLLAEGSGTGTATQLGRFTITWEVVVDLASGVGTGSAQLIAPNGDVLTADVLGHGSVTSNGFSIEEDYTVTGGTGRFDGATGSLAVHRLVAFTGEAVGTLEGTLVIDHGH
jgi:hypothetical protein